MGFQPPRWLVWLAAAVLGAGGTGWTVSNGSDISDRVGKLEGKMELVLDSLHRIERIRE